MENERKTRGGAIEDRTLAGFSLAAGNSMAFVHPSPAQLAAVGSYQIAMWITAVNGAPDLNPANNLATSEVITVSRVPPKKAILTNHTGAWCGFCPDGYVRLEQALDHDRTLRAMLGGTWGTPGIIPPAVTDGDVSTFTYSHVLPAGFDETRVSLIGLVSEYDAGNDENRAILNSAQRSLRGIFDDGFEWGDTADWAATTP